MEGVQAPGGGAAPQAPVPASQAQVAQPSQDDVIRQKLAEVLGDILAKAQELGFELATMDHSQLAKCPAAKPLVDKSRELIVALKKLFELRKELGGQA